MIDVNKIKVGDKLKLESWIGDISAGEVVTVVEDGTLGSRWITSDFVEISELAGVEDWFSLAVPSTDQKIKVLTSDYEYQGLYKGSIHTLIDYEGDEHNSFCVFKHNGKTWKIDQTQCELVEDKQQVILEAKSNPALEKQEDVKAPKKATEFLSKALSLLEERGKDYDQPEGERSMGKTVVAFNAITGHNLKESDGWLILQLLKDVRQNQNRDSYHADSAEDCISYAALKAEALAEGK